MTGVAAQMMMMVWSAGLTGNSPRRARAAEEVVAVLFALAVGAEAREGAEMVVPALRAVVTALANLATTKSTTTTVATSTTTGVRVMMTTKRRGGHESPTTATGRPVPPQPPLPPPLQLPGCSQDRNQHRHHCCNHRPEMKAAGTERKEG